MTLSELYTARGAELDGDPTIYRVASDSYTAEWRHAGYSALVYAAPPPYIAKLIRKGGKKPDLLFHDGPKTARQIALIIWGHLRDPRNTT